MVNELDPNEAARRKERLELEVRLMAIEYALVHIGAAAFRRLDITAPTARKLSQDAGAKLLSETFPGADPAEADHWSAELADRVQGLLAWLSDILEASSSSSHG
jgi:hypothetical protein